MFEKLLPDQLVLLLEHLLEQKTLNPRTLQSLERTYHLPQQDAEVSQEHPALRVVKKGDPITSQTVETAISISRVPRCVLMSEEQALPAKRKLLPWL